MGSKNFIASTGIIIFNFIISVCLIITGTVYYILIKKHYDLIIDNYNIASIMAITAGVIIFLGSWVLYRLSQENMKIAVLMCGKISLILYTTLLVVGIYECIRILDTELQSKFISKISGTFSDEINNTDYKNQFYKLQSKYHCCGVNGVDDYRNKTHLPASCCYECHDCADKYCSDKNYYWINGCGTIMYDFTVNYATGISVTAIVLGSIGVINVLAIPVWVENTFS